MDAHQHRIEADDLAPVGDLGGRRLVVQGGDGGLDGVGGGRRLGPQRRLDQGQALGDQRGVPEAAILVLQQHDIAGGVDPGRAAGVVQQHQRQQAHDRPAPGQQGVQPAAKLDRLERQAAARVAGVGLGEHQVEHRQHPGDALVQQLRRRRLVGDAGGADLRLRPHQPLGHGLLGHQEGPGDGGRGQRADHPQGQRHLRLQAERRVAAGEDQPQQIVVTERRLGLVSGLGLGGHGDLGVDLQGVPARAEGGAAAELVEGLVPADLDQPGAGVGRRRLGPGGGGGGEGLLQPLLGQVEVADQADQRGQRLGAVAAEGVFDSQGVRPSRRPRCGLLRMTGIGDTNHTRHGEERARRARVSNHAPHIAQTGRTSTEPYLAVGILAAMAVASSRSLASTR